MSPERWHQFAPAHQLQLVSALVVVQLKAEAMLKVASSEAEVLPHDLPYLRCLGEYRTAVDENAACHSVEVVEQNVLAADMRRGCFAKKTLHEFALRVIPGSSVDVGIASDALEEPGSQVVGRGN